MQRLMQFVFILCVIVDRSSYLNALPELSETLTTTTLLPQDESDGLTTERSLADDVVRAQQRSIASNSELDESLANEDRHAAFRKRAKPLKNIFMGIYKNYKSTYLGNKTLTEYRRTLRTHETAEKQHEENDENQQTATETDAQQVEETNDTDAGLVNEAVDSKKETEDSDLVLDLDPEPILKPRRKTPIKSRNITKKKKKQRLRKRNFRRPQQHRNRLPSNLPEESKEASSVPTHHAYRYDFGPGVNMSLDMNNDIVNLHLDGDNLKDLMQGRWLKDTSEGRGKKYEMITRVLPLFILPFLIQSAIVPFLVTKLKLLLMKSILVGKLAIFLLVISAIRNSNKMMQTYEVAPSYWAGEPSRRSELAAAASAAAYNGYRVEGKPTAWIN